MGSFGNDFGGGFGGGPGQDGQGFGGGGGQDFGGGFGGGGSGQDFGGGFGGGGFGGGQEDFGETESVRTRTKKDKKSRRNKQADGDMYGNDAGGGGGFDMGGVGGGSFDMGGGGGRGGDNYGGTFDTSHTMDPSRNDNSSSRNRMYDDRNQDMRPSAIGESLGQVPSSMGPSGRDNYGFGGGNYGARGASSANGYRAGDYGGRRGELGLGDDFRNRDHGFNDPVEVRDFGYVDRGGSDLGGMEPVKRGFSFSFNDIPKASHNEPRYDGSSSRPEASRWNPFDGMRRNWEPGRVEASTVHTEAAHLHGPGIHTHLASHPALASSAMPPSYSGGGPAGTLEHELFKTEERVAALRTKLSRLESDMVHGAQSPVSGFIRVVVTHLVAGGHLGLRMRGCMVSEIVNAEAREFGWFVGDQVLKVNGYPVQTEPEFAREVGKAMDGYRMTGKPLVFDVVRQPAEAGMSPMMGAVPNNMMGGKGSSFSGPDPQLERLAAENARLRQEMIGQSMALNGPMEQSMYLKAQTGQSMALHGPMGQSMALNGPIGQSMMLNAPPTGMPGSFSSIPGSFNGVGGKGGPMLPGSQFPTMDQLPPTGGLPQTMRSGVPPGAMPPMGMMPPTSMAASPRSKRIIC